MKINSIDSVRFKSKIRIRPQVLEALDYVDSSELCRQLYKLERNGNNDLVILAQNNNYPNDANKFVMEVIEKKDNNFYINMPFEEAEISSRTINDNGNNNLQDKILYNLADMYKSAKQNMIKVSDDFNSYLHTYFKYL